jgi:lactosylceramide 4-alpha-galactosyltransferase
MNPDMEIYFLFATNFDKVNLKLNELTEALFSYPNIHLRFANVSEFAKGTKLQNFFERDGLANSSYPVEHLSDIMRILALNKYGGQYFDLDVISLVPLSVVNLKNFGCLEWHDSIGNNIINLDLESGREITDKVLE